MNPFLSTSLKTVPIALLCVLLVGCAKPPRTHVLLLPQADGSASAVNVTTGNHTQKLETPLQRFVVDVDSPPQLDQSTHEEVHKNFAPLFSAAPLPPNTLVLFFQSGTMQLTPESEANFKMTLGQAQQRIGGDLLITGHTDSHGAEMVNDQLSLRRAQRVRQMYIDHNFPPERIEAVGRGERELATPTPDNTKEALNRRVVIVVR